MACPISEDEVKKLKLFIGLCSSNPKILNMPQLKFFKDFIVQLGGEVPPGDFGFSADAGSHGQQESKPHPKVQVDPEPEPEPESESQSPLEESDTESDMEIDTEGCVDPDNEMPQQMGDSSKIPTEDECEKASELRSKAANNYSEQNFTEAISCYTEAILLNPTNALFYAKRGQTFIKLGKPNACIRDCDRALELNCDSAAAYKFRGRAYRLLGKWENAAKDLRQACKIDFDEEADEWLREVTPNAKKLDQHRIKYERKRAERELKERQERILKAQEANKKAAADKNESGANNAGVGGAGAGAFSQADLLSAFQDPEVSAAFQDIIANPANITKYQSNPKVMNLVTKIGSAMGSSGGGGFPGMFGAGAGGFPGGAFPNFAGAPPPAAPNAKPKPPPTDFQDDGLD